MRRGKERGEVLAPVYFGIRTSDVTNEMLSDIVKLYFETGGGYPSDHKTITKADIIRESNWGTERRFGSRFTGHSKLNVNRVFYAGIQERDVLRFTAYGNTTGDHLSKKEMAEVMAWEDQFKKAASDYLEKTGKGIPFVEEY